MATEPKPSPVDAAHAAIAGANAELRDQFWPQLRKQIGPAAVRLEECTGALIELVEEHERMLGQLTLVRAHLESAIGASNAGYARAHEQFAVSLLSKLGVPTPNADQMALATVQATS